MTCRHDLAHDRVPAISEMTGRPCARMDSIPHMIVVDAAGEDGTEDDPQIDDGSQQSTVQSAEDGAETSDVQQLNQEDASNPSSGRSQRRR